MIRPAFGFDLTVRNKAYHDVLKWFKEGSCFPSILASPSFGIEHGIDEEICELIDSIFDRMDDEQRGDFVRQSIEIMPLGSDLSGVIYETILWMLEVSPGSIFIDQYDSLRCALRHMVPLLAKSANLQETDPDEWETVLFALHDDSWSIELSAGERQLRDFLVAFANACLFDARQDPEQIVHLFALWFEACVSESQMDGSDIMAFLADAVVTSIRQAPQHKMAEAYLLREVI